MNSFWQDLRYGLHALAKNPGFTAVAMLTLALGIGANTALFSVVDTVLLKKLPVNDPDRLVLFNSVSNKEFSPGSHTGTNRRDPQTGLTTRSSFPYQTFVRLREQRGACSDIIAFGSLSLNVSANGLADVAGAQAVSGNYYEVLGVPAFIGRTIIDADDNASAHPVAMLSYRYWQSRFGGDGNIVGKQINVNNIAFTIIGVAPPGFEGAMDVGSSLEVAIPLAWEPQVSSDRSWMKGAGDWWLRLMGRLKPGATIEQARASLDPAFQQSVLEHREARQSTRTTRGQELLRPLEPKDYPHLGTISGSQGEMNGREFFARPLYLLLGVVGLVLLIACANVANLLLVRASSRQKEIAVRLAMGASRWRLIRQLMTESVLLAILGGGAGILVAIWIKDTLLSVSEWAGREMLSIEPRLDLRVLGFTLGLSLLTGIVFGLVPALRATRLDLTPALKDTGRSSSAASRSFLSKALVISQVSLSLLLLVGAGLLVRTLINLQHVDTGFNERNLLLFNVDPSLLGYRDERLRGLYQQMFTRLEAVPGVQSVTFSRLPLLSHASSGGTFDRPGAKPGPDGTVPPTGEVYYHNVRENFFETMGIPLLTGRTFTAQDDLHAPKVVIVNQTFAREYFPGENPVGKRFSFDFGKPDPIEIIGLVKDAKYTSQREETPATMYRSWLQTPGATDSMTFEVRTTGEPRVFVAAIRQAVREVEANLPLNNIKTQIEQADETLSMERLFAKLMSLFGILAQQLASIGLYGVMAYSVSRRTHEIGIRMALGADRGKVLRMILRQGMTLTVIGVALGLGAAYVLTKYLQTLTSMLFGVKPRDPLTFSVAAALLTVVALVACLIPARRATKVDPLVALRYE
jgi:predicted permease